MDTWGIPLIVLGALALGVLLGLLLTEVQRGRDVARLQATLDAERRRAGTTRGADEVRTLGRELYVRVRIFATHLADMRRAMEKSAKACNRAEGSLEQGVLPRASAPEGAP